jgi:hypothetical protein
MSEYCKFKQRRASGFPDVGPCSAPGCKGIDLWLVGVRRDECRIEGRKFLAPLWDFVDIMRDLDRHRTPADRQGALLGLLVAAMALAFTLCHWPAQ